MTVTKEIELDDPFENMGAKLVNEVAQKTSDVAGDGTTTATVLARAIFQEGLRNITAGANPMAVRRGIDKAVEAAVEKLDEHGQDGLQARRRSPRSAPSAPTTTRRSASCWPTPCEKVGKDGVITVEEGKTTETTLEFVEGMQFDKGYISPVLHQPARRRWTCVLEDAYILIHEKKISNLRELLPLLEKVAQTGKPLLIIAEDVEGEALAALVVNKLRGVLNVCAVKAPGFGDRRKAMLGDIAVLTGGTFISEDLGIKLENVDARAARPGQEGHGRQGQHDDRPRRRQAGRHPEARSSRSAARSRQTESEYDKEKFQERLAKLTGGVAIISVGAATEAEMKQKKARVEDALHATRAAVEEGILPGGGVALLRVHRGGREARREAQGRREDRRRDRRSGAGGAGPHRSPRTAATTARWSPTRSSRASRRTSATTPTPASTSTCSRPASSTRRRSPARPCRTPPASPG